MTYTVNRTLLTNVTLTPLMTFDPDEKKYT